MIITKRLEQDRLNFEDCRGKSYENQKQWLAFSFEFWTSVTYVN